MTQTEMTGAELREARQMLGLSQGQIAELLGYRQEHISLMETGRQSIQRPTEIAVRAMLAFGLPETW